jgi:hypothetical protein
MADTPSELPDLTRPAARYQDCTCRGKAARPFSADHETSCPAAERLRDEEHDASWIAAVLGEPKVMEAGRLIASVYSKHFMPLDEHRDFGDFEAPIPLELVGGDTVLIEPVGGNPMAVVVTWERYCAAVLGRPTAEKTPEWKPDAIPVNRPSAGVSADPTPDRCVNPAPPESSPAAPRTQRRIGRARKTGRPSAFHDAEDEAALRRILDEHPEWSGVHVADAYSKATGKLVHANTINRYRRERGIPSAPAAAATADSPASMAGRRLTSDEREILRTLLADYPDESDEKIAARFGEIARRPISADRVSKYRLGYVSFDETIARMEDVDPRPPKPREIPPVPGARDPTPEEIAAETERLRMKHLEEKRSGHVPDVANGRVK